SEQIHQLYALAQQVGLEEFQAAVELATEQQLYGAEYLKGLLLKPAGSGSNAATLKPTQPAVERLLSEYEPLVANRFSAIPEENEIERAVG
ncbi:MAG: hypothetical protein HXX08_14805, partial [Chloroflexi bacterium]|nr:hypothetical protein [Chloroflexota bacterium]